MHIMAYNEMFLLMHHVSTSECHIKTHNKKKQEKSFQYNRIEITMEKFIIDEQDI